MFKISIINKNIKDKNKILLLYLLTLSRIFFAFLLFIFLVKINKYNDFILNLIALLFVILVEITDLLDGYLARKFNLVTFVGKIIDPFSDSISRLIVFGSLAYKGLCLPFVPIIMVLRDITIAYTRIAQVSYSIDCSVRLSGKLKAFIQGASAIILISLPLFNLDLNLKSQIIYYLSYLTSLIVLYSLFDYTLVTIIKYKKLKKVEKNR